MKKHGLLAGALAMGLSFSTTAFAQTTPYVQSDTTISFSRPQNQTYQVKFTVHGTHSNPHIVAGNGKVLQTLNCKKAKDSKGNDTYLFKVKAIGKVGQTSAIYTTLPGQKAVRHFVLTVGKPSNSIKPFSTSTTKAAGTVKRGQTASISIKGKPNTLYALSVQYKSGNSKATNIGTKKSDTNGNVSWSWKVGTNTTPGTHPIIITGGGRTYNTSFKTA